MMKPHNVSLLGTLAVAADGSFIFTGRDADRSQALRIEFDAARHAYGVLSLHSDGWREFSLSLHQGADLLHQSVNLSTAASEAEGSLIATSSRITSDRSSLVSRTVVDEAGHRRWTVKQHFADGSTVLAKGQGQTDCETSSKKVSVEGTLVWTRETQTERLVQPGLQTITSTARTKYASGAEVVKEGKAAVTAAERISKGAVRVVSEGKAVDANGVDITSKLPVDMSERETVDRLMGEWNRDGTRTYADGSSRSTKGKGKATAAGYVETITSTYTGGGDSGTSTSLVEQQFRRPEGASWVASVEDDRYPDVDSGSKGVAGWGARDYRGHIIILAISWDYTTGWYVSNFIDIDPETGGGTKIDIYRQKEGDPLEINVTTVPPPKSGGGGGPPDEESRPGDDVGDWDEGGGDEGPKFPPVTTKAEINLHLGRHKVLDAEREGSRYGVEIGAWLRANIDTSILLGGADGTDGNLGDTGPDFVDRARSSGIHINVGGADSDGWGLETNPRAFIELSQQVLAQSLASGTEALGSIAVALSANLRTGRLIDTTMSRGGFETMPVL